MSSSFLTIPFEDLSVLFSFIDLSIIGILRGKHNSTIKILCWTADLIGWQFLKWHTLITFRSTLALVLLPLLLGLLLLLAVQGGDLEGLLLAHLLRLEVAELEVLRLLLDDGLLLANLGISKNEKNKVTGSFLQT